ncbi:hypothetical protein ACQ143_02550 [Microbacterium sp. MC2]
MTTALAHRDLAGPALTAHARLLAVGPNLWRVVDTDGRAVGHLAAQRGPHGVRWEARRFHVPSRRFRTVGAFWTAAEAVDCLRLSR